MGFILICLETIINFNYFNMHDLNIKFLYYIEIATFMIKKKYAVNSTHFILHKILIIS
jgi:hypothetical protein